MRAWVGLTKCRWRVGFFSSSHVLLEPLERLVVLLAALLVSRASRSSCSNLSEIKLASNWPVAHAPTQADKLHVQAVHCMRSVRTFEVSFCQAGLPGGLLLSTLAEKWAAFDIEPVFSTLCPSVTSTCSTSKLHLNTLQYSVWGDVMLLEETYGKDYSELQLCLYWIGDSIKPLC